jgi:hypothetical protein|tara:strand:+ start:172 stop:603 length:432 start_codon:yes stop_codon:yes gene_type:complete
MILSEITLQDVIAGKNWTLNNTEEPNGNSFVTHVDRFSTTDIGLFSAMVQFGDKSAHAGLVVKSFLQGGDELDLFVKTKFGWLNIQEDGFMRASGKYSHEVFPFDYFIANSWVMGNPPTQEKDSPHGKVFHELAEQLRTADVS